VNALWRQLKGACKPHIWTEEQALQVYRFEDGFLGFAGHFPNRPILPALVQILMGQNLASSVFDSELELLEIKAAKFLDPITPGQEITICSVYKTEKNKILATNKLYKQNRLAASYKLILQKT
jgi:3-hydroxyacyl-[acyl-carrier-protein] dehydratase